jgi:nicotinate-nucleotide adenylyltransferase
MGGSFDPPHVGHFLAAVDACERLELDRVDFIPAATQPFKPSGPVASSALRLAMLRAMVAHDPRFAVNAVEIERGGLSFMVDTVAAYRASSPEDRLFLLLGADAAAGIGRWREPDRLLSMVQLVILTRGTESVAPTVAGHQPRVLATRRMDVSSTEVRARARDRRSLRGFVLNAVEEIILESALYR